MSETILSHKITLEDFNNNYWYKEELKYFCQLNGIEYNVGKPKLEENIRHFILTGEKILPIPTTNRVISNNEPLTLDTVIDENYRNTERHRAFFKSIIGEQFKFNVPMMNWCKENVGKTLRDAVVFWVEEEKRKRAGVKNPIGKQFKWNQYTRDYFSDPRNVYKGKQQCIDSWNRRKETIGEHKYNPLEGY